MKHGKGSDLPGMTQSQGARIGVIYVSPDDDRKTVLTAILAEEKLKREQIVLVLPQKNKAFQRPEDFDDLKMLRRKLQAELIFVTPAGPGPAEFARQRRFAVFSTVDSFVRSFTTGSTSQPDQPAQPNNRSGKRGLFGSAKNVASSAAAGAAGFAAGRAAGNPPVQRRHPGSRPSSGLTSSNDITNQPTQQPVAQRPSTPLPPQSPPSHIEDVEDQDTALLPPSITDANTVNEHDAEAKTDIRPDQFGDAAGPGAGHPAADAVPHTLSTGQAGGPDPNIDDDDDWDALPPPPPGQSIPSKLPSTPAATSAGTGRRNSTGTSTGPDPILFPMPSGTTPKGPKPTKKLPETPADAPTQVDTPLKPTTTPLTKRDSGKMAAAGAVGAAAGAMAVGALTSNTVNTGKTPNAPARTTTGRTPGTPAHNAGNGHTLTPAGNISAVSAGWPPPSGPMSPRRTTSSNRNRRAILIVALVILALLVIGGVVFSMVASAPPATIHITPASKTVQETYLIQGVTDKANPDNRQVTVRQLTSPRAATDTVNATGQGQQKATRATGMLTFRNGTASPLTIAPTALASSNGAQVIADQNVTIPALNTVTGVAGAATVSAHAVSLGSSGNIAAQSINGNCCVQGITVINFNAFTGGQDLKNYTFLQQSDVDQVANKHQAPLKSDAENAVKGQMNANEQFLINPNCDPAKTTVDAPVGDQGLAKALTSAKVTVSVNCSAKVFDAKAMQTIAQNALTQKASQDPGKGYVLAPPIVTQVQSLQPQQDGNITFSVMAQGIWYYQWTDTIKQDLLNKVKGKSIKDAQAILSKYPGSARIEITNGATTLPSDLTQIKLDVQPVKGLPGGSNQIPTITPVSTSAPIQTPAPTSQSGNLGS